MRVREKLKKEKGDRKEVYNKKGKYRREEEDNLKIMVKVRDGGSKKNGANMPFYQYYFVLFYFIFEFHHISVHAQTQDPEVILKFQVFQVYTSNFMFLEGYMCNFPTNLQLPLESLYLNI